MSSVPLGEKNTFATAIPSYVYGKNEPFFHQEAPNKRIPVLAGFLSIILLSILYFIISY
jgi:hypothetical protein